MDNFKIHLSTPTIYSENPEYSSYNLSLEIGDTHYADTRTSVAELLSLGSVSDAEFYLFNCSCGVPECAGYYEPAVQSETPDGNIKWTVPESFGTVKQEYIFNKAKFQEELKLTLDAMLKLEAIKAHEVSLIETYSWQEDGEDHENTRIDYLLEYVNRVTLSYTSELAYANFLKSEFPDIANKKFNWVYDGTISPEDLTLDVLIVGILNDSIRWNIFTPDLIKVFYAKTKLAVKAIRNLEKKDTRLFYLLARQAYSFEGGSVHDALRYDLDKIVTPEDFDYKKLRIKISD